MTLRDKDIFPEVLSTPDPVWKDRITGKAVIFNDNNQIALIGNRIHSFFLLPGGGIENGENIIQGVKRECREETGLEVELTREIGVSEDFRIRDAKHCITIAYFATALSKGTPALTSNEKDIGVYLKWFPFSEALTLLEDQREKVKKGEVKFYNTCFNIWRDHFFLLRAEKMLPLA